MNIVHMVFSFNTGGIENLLVDMINNWAEKDRIMLCIVNDSKNDCLISKIHRRSNVEIVCIGRPEGGEKLAYCRRLYRILRDFHAEIIHCHSNSVFKFCLPIKLLCPDISFILTVHDTIIYRRLGIMDRFLHKCFLNRICAISEVVKKEIVEKGFSEKRVEIIYNGVDEKKFEGIPKKKHEKKCIICIARIYPFIKGQDILIRAVGRLSEKRSDFQCCLVGGALPGQNELLRELEILIQNEKVENYVKLLGDRNDVPALLADSDIFVLPSRYEGFGISIIEAMLSHVVVVASDIDGPKEIIKNNQYGYLFEKENDEQLADILNILLDQDHSEMEEKAFQYASEVFSMDTMLRKQRAVYIKVREQNERR